METQDRPRTTEQMFSLARSGALSRRQLLRRATALGLSSSTIALLLTACGGDDEEAAPTATRATSTAAPLVSSPTPAAATTPTTGAASIPVPTAGASPATALKPARNQTFVKPEGSEVRTLDPAGASETQSINVIRAAYEGLVAQKARSADIEPRLATSWDISSDAQTFTFQLRQGVKFHDGTMLDADAVKKSFERTIQLNLATAAPLSVVDGIEAVDQFTVRFVLKAPNAYFVENLTTIPIISPTAVEQNDKGGDLAAGWLEAGNTAGTGPYRLTEFRRDEQHTMEAFADYWRGWDGNHLQRLVFTIVPEATTRRTMLEKAEAHFYANMPADDVKALENNPVVEIEWNKNYRFYTIPINVTKPPLDNVKMRQALSYAFDYETFLNQVWLGHGTVPTGPTAPGFIGFDPNLPPLKQDLARAAQLVAESGVSNASIDAFYVDTLAEERQSVTVLQDALRGLGIELRVQAMPWATMFNLVSSPETAPHLTNLIILPTRPDPVFTLEWMFGCGFVGKPYNWSYYCNQQVQDRIDEARRTVDRAKGAELLQEANRLIVEDAPAIWYGQPDRNDVYNAKLQDFAPIVIGYPGEVDFYPMWFAE